MTDDEMYLENNRYLAAAFYVLPLPSGRIAILTPRRDPFRVVESWEEALTVGPLAWSAVPRREVELEPKPKISLGSIAGLLTRGEPK